MLIKNLFRYWTYQVFSPGTVLREKYESFKALLEYDKAAHEHMAALEDIYYNRKKTDFQTIVKTYEQFADVVWKMVEELFNMCPSSYWALKSYFKKFDFYVRFMLAPPEFVFSPPFTLGLQEAASSHEALTGKKAFILSCLNHDLHLPIPGGFVVTTNAFHYFLEANGLQGPINDRLAGLDIHDPVSLEATAAGIQALILNADVPEEVESAVTRALENLQGQGKTDLRVAVRSSAVKEDGTASFAGQYRTVLNVNKEGVLKAYKQVVASKYSSRALFYRVSLGILDHETPMAVLVLEMVDSKASGVIYTRDIAAPFSESLLIHSVWGQGELLVDGQVSADVIKVSKDPVTPRISIDIADKQKAMVLGSENRRLSIHRDDRKRKMVSLDDPAILTLARWGRNLEDFFQEPQDIEWCQDGSGKLFILQSRPLNRLLENRSDREKQGRSIENKILCHGGETICPGMGSGPVFRLETMDQLSAIPRGAVLVIRFALPLFVTAIHKMAGVIIETGSCAGHFSSIAREFNLPAIVNVGHGFDDLVQGEIVTVDAGNGVVYEGRVGFLKKKSLPGKNVFDDSTFMVKLRYVISFCAKLKLTDPESPDFVPEGCRSLHDIIRFVHETAMKEMFFMGHRKGSRKKGAKKLILPIPMLFYVLDVGGGVIKNRENEKTLRPEMIACLPMKNLFKGLLHAGICWTETTHFDWEEYDKIVMAGGIISADSPQFGSYAVVSKEYLNVNFRFGYHFVILDVICSPFKEDNHILFRFSGGGGSPDGRRLRADFIREVLRRLGFVVTVTSDLVDGQLKQASVGKMEKVLDTMGRLLGATKLMDMYLKDSMDIQFIVDEFMQGRYDFRQDVPASPSDEPES